MTNFSIIYLFKRRAKKLAKAQQFPLSESLNLLSQEAGFQHWHEAQAVAKKTPQDPRLVAIAFGTNDLSETVFDSSVYPALEELLEEEMSGAIAETNAEAFSIDDMQVNKTDYDESTGILALSADIQYAGDQIPDKVYSGTSFHLEVIIRLFWDQTRWVLAEYDALEMISGISDQELDWQQQAADGTLYS